MNVPPIATAGVSAEPVVEEWARTPGIHVPGLEDPEMRAWALGGGRRSRPVQKGMDNRLNRRAQCAHVRCRYSRRP